MLKRDFIEADKHAVCEHERQVSISLYDWIEVITVAYAGLPITRSSYSTKHKISSHPATSIGACKDLVGEYMT